MTYKEFRDKYNGKYVDYDGSYGSQCWDLAQYYFTECLGLPASVLGGCGLVSNMLYGDKRAELDKYFEEVSLNNMYQGDVCIWEYGHIAIFDNWDGNSCWYFSQNPNPCQVMTINVGGQHAFRLKTAKPEPKPEPAPVVDDYYTVVSGDTLSAIANRYGTTYQELAKYNGIENLDLIFPGQVIRIPKNKEDNSKTYYTVQKGDTLWAIAEKFYGNGEQYKKIADANGIENPEMIFPNQTLYIPE